MRWMIACEWRRVDGCLFLSASSFFLLFFIFLLFLPVSFCFPSIPSRWSWVSMMTIDIVHIRLSITIYNSTILYGT